MGPTTRSASSTPVKKAAPAPSAPTKQLPTQQDPLHLLIIPKDISSDARLLLLPCPRDASKTRFLFCPSKGLFVFTRIAAPQSDYRSLLFAPAQDHGPVKVGKVRDDDAISQGYAQKEAAFLVATPFDVMFLLLPLLPSSTGNAAKVMFQPLDDLFETQITDDAHLRYLIQQGKHLLEKAMSRFCDTIDGGNEKMFRVNDDKVGKMLHTKAQRMVAKGLPTSMEDRFVTRALETPVLSIKREESTISTITRETTTDDEESDSKNESFDSISTPTGSAAPSVFSEVSIASSTTTIAPEPVSSRIMGLMRLKVALDFMFASYFSPAMAEYLRDIVMRNKSMTNFTPLEGHLKHLAALRAEALASRSLGDFSRKRGNADDDEAAEDRVEKKRKLEEEEKRKKANLSRGVRDLGKVNVTGMKKMSDFFGKKPATAKAKS